MIVSFLGPAYFQGRSVSFREGIPKKNGGFIQWSFVGVDFCQNYEYC